MRRIPWYRVRTLAMRNARILEGYLAGIEGYLSNFWMSILYNNVWAA